MLFVDYAEVEQTSSLVSAVYALTGFGHQAVMLFFVMSGFLIGSVVIRDVRAKRWSWKSYLVDRTVRMHVVVLPALVLTLCCDRLGLTFGDARVYGGGHPSTALTARLAETGTPLVLAGNALFLQTIFVPTFGTNGPLWSLANEYWYYVLFPLIWITIAGSRPWWRRGILSALAIAGLALIGHGIRLGFVVWLMGVALRLLPPIPRLAAGGRPIVVSIVAIVGACGYLLASRVSTNIPGNDLWLGGLFALMLYLVLHDGVRVKRGPIGLAAFQLANCSFTLYAVHFPVLALIAAIALGVQRVQPTPANLALATVLAVIVVAFAWLLARVTERHTLLVRNFVRSWIAIPPRAVAATGLVSQFPPPTSS